MEMSFLRSPLLSRLVRRLMLALSVLTPGSYLGISLVSAHILTQPSNHANRLDPEAVSPDAQPWRTRTSDGVTLRGWYYPTDAQRRLIVCVHGMHGTWNDLAGIGRDLHRRGYDVLLFDLRGHGQSAPARLTMGRLEREDLRAVLAWAKSQGYSTDRVGWIGQSMGAATLLMEGARNREIGPVVLDSPFANLPELLDVQLSEHSGLPKVFNPGILFAAHHAFGVRTDDLIPLRLADRWDDRPVLLIHGEADSLVPVHQARQLARDIGPSCQAIFLPGVDHVNAYYDYRAIYVTAVDRFFDEHLAR